MHDVQECAPGSGFDGGPPHRQCRVLGSVRPYDNRPVHGGALPSGVG
ncbi:hypothetical protein [Streptomyces lutosisoli]|uniref:Uncharacterized protein n=1 Tax=Streptomyces lutosisoli TaxID=2665721 RepID=A0ABW2VZE5_9ACTN